MSPTIRIDEEVWAWLQERARPFEDTPNSVLRRVAGLDGNSDKGKPRDGGRRMLATNRGHGDRVTGELLNRKYKLGAKHALYHKDGTLRAVARVSGGTLR